MTIERLIEALMQFPDDWGCNGDDIDKYWMRHACGLILERHVKRRRVSAKFDLFGTRIEQVLGKGWREEANWDRAYTDLVSAKEDKRVRDKVMKKVES